MDTNMLAIEIRVYLCSFVVHIVFSESAVLKVKEGIMFGHVPLCDVEATSKEDRPECH